VVDVVAIAYQRNVEVRYCRAKLRDGGEDAVFACCSGVEDLQCAVGF
jgi:hypothetical protein